MRRDESNGAGWQTLYSSFGNTDSEQGVMPVVMRARDNAKRYPVDPYGDSTIGDRLDWLKPRLLRYQAMNVLATAVSYAGGHAFFSYHTLQSSITGSVTNYQGSGTGIDIRIFRSGSEDLILTGSTVAGAYSASWWDDTLPLYAVARENSTYLGRSDYFTASFNG
jgi:hypothetical protein